MEHSSESSRKFQPLRPLKGRSTLPACSGGLRKIDTKPVFQHVPTVNIALTPELEKAVAEKVRAGGYADESQFVCEILHETLARSDNETEWLKGEVQKGVDDIEAGRFVDIESREQFVAMVSEGQ